MDSNIELTPPAMGLARELLQEPGAFLWWYVDLLDAEGSGVVLIWSFGLPFLPGLRRARESDQEARPRCWPALNLVVYERGRTVFYALKRLRPSDAAWTDEEAWTFKDTRVQVTREGDRLALCADLDVSLPCGERCTGVLELDGAARRPGAMEKRADALPFHDWSPQSGPSRGRARLTIGGAELAIEGRAYHDRNGGLVPLWDLDIRRWLWGRIPFAREEMVFFALWRRSDALPAETLLLFIDEEGRTRREHDVAVSLLEDSRAWTGLSVPRAFELSVGGERCARIERCSLLDVGPFYFRMTATAQTRGERALGFVEGIDPARVDRTRERPFVRMRVHDENDGSSVWLPLFSGRSEGRLGRLCRSIFPLGRAREVKGA